LRISFRGREQRRRLSVGDLVGAIDRALLLLGQNRVSLLTKFKVIVGAIVVGQSAIVGVGRAEDRRATGPAAYQLRAKELRRQPQLKCRLIDKVPKSLHILAQTPVD